MKPDLLLPVETCSKMMTRSASFVWHHAPCAVVTEKVIAPKLQETFQNITGTTPPAQKVWHKATGKRPLRQRICRFAFKEFFRSCGLSPRMIHLEAFAPWQVALGAGVLGAWAMWILA